MGWDFFEPLGQAKEIFLKRLIHSPCYQGFHDLSLLLEYTAVIVLSVTTICLIKQRMPEFFGLDILYLDSIPG